MRYRRVSTTTTTPPGSSQERRGSSAGTQISRLTLAIKVPLKMKMGEKEDVETSRYAVCPRTVG